MSQTPTPLSLNEICFYFTRAAVGAGAPFGIGEDFAEASKALAYLSFDPAQAAVPALRGLGCGQSGTSLSLRTVGDAIHLGSSDGLAMSALYAGPVIADRLSIEAGCGRERHLRLDDTDQPLLVLGAGCRGGHRCSPDRPVLAVAERRTRRGRAERRQRTGCRPACRRHRFA